jgi:hypothetical protein
LGFEIDKSPPWFLDSSLFAAEAAALPFIPKNAETNRSGGSNYLVPANVWLRCANSCPNLRMRLLTDIRL